MIDKETYERLKKYERHLQRGYKGNYTYGFLSNDFDVLYEIYKANGGRERLKYSCNTCCLRLTKYLGKLYYEYQEAPEPPKETVSDVISEEVEQVPTKHKKTPKTTKKTTKRK